MLPTTSALSTELVNIHECSSKTGLLMHRKANDHMLKVIQTGDQMIYHLQDDVKVVSESGRTDVITTCGCNFMSFKRAVIEAMDYFSFCQMHKEVLPSLYIVDAAVLQPDSSRVNMNCTTTRPIFTDFNVTDDDVFTFATYAPRFTPASWSWSPTGNTMARKFIDLFNAVRFANDLNGTIVELFDDMFHTFNGIERDYEDEDSSDQLINVDYAYYTRFRNVAQYAYELITMADDFVAKYTTAYLKSRITSITNGALSDLTPVYGKIEAQNEAINLRGRMLHHLKYIMRSYGRTNANSLNERPMHMDSQLARRNSIVPAHDIEWFGASGRYISDLRILNLINSSYPGTCISASSNGDYPIGLSLSSVKAFIAAITSCINA